MIQLPSVSVSLTEMLTKDSSQVDTIWDGLFPDFVRLLPDDLARLDQVLDAPGVLKKFEQHWGRANLNVGRPSIAMTTYVRLMALKHRHCWGYERLVRRVADSFHLRRFCRISIVAEVPDESTIRKLTRRLGPELVDDLTREVIQLAVKERGFKVRAMRCDSTVQEADIRHPTDSGLAADAVKVLARAARKVHAKIPGLTRQVRDRSRAASKRIRALNRSLAGRTGQAKQEVQRLTEEIAELAKASLGQARRLLAEARLTAGAVSLGLPRQANRAVAELEQMIGLSSKVVEQIRQRFAGEKIADRVVSLFDPEARPIRKGKRSKPTEFGYMNQYAELSANTRRGARGPAAAAQRGRRQHARGLLAKGDGCRGRGPRFETARGRLRPWLHRQSDPHHNGRTGQPCLHRRQLSERRFAPNPQTSGLSMRRLRGPHRPSSGSTMVHVPG